MLSTRTWKSAHTENGVREWVPVQLGVYADTKECVHLWVKGLSLPVCYLLPCFTDRPTYWLIDWLNEVQCSGDLTGISTWSDAAPKGPRAKAFPERAGKTVLHWAEPTCRVAQLFSQAFAEKLPRTDVFCQNVFPKTESLLFCGASGVTGGFSG